MKKLLLSVAVFLSLSVYAEKTKSEAPLILEYNYVDKTNQKSLLHLENDWRWPASSQLSCEAGRRVNQ